MGWASPYIERLKQGLTVSFRPRGNSMSGKIESGELCSVSPVSQDTKIMPGNIVLCTVGNNDYLHIVLAIGGDGRYKIGNNKGGINGWIDKSSIFGKLESVGD